MTDAEAYEFVDYKVRPLLKGLPEEDVFLVVGFMMGLCQCVLADTLGSNKAMEVICRAATENATGIRTNLH